MWRDQLSMVDLTLPGHNYHMNLSTVSNTLCSMCPWFVWLGQVLVQVFEHVEILSFLSLHQHDQ